MKTSKKLSEHTYLPCSKSLFSGFGGHLIPAAALTCALLALPLSGCFSPRPQQTKYIETVNTAASVYSEYDFGGDSLPFGVTLQVDPSVLIPCEFERVVDGDTIIVHDPDGNRLRVRLTGINAEESVLEDDSKNTDEGRAASAFIKDLLSTVDTVYLEYDEGQFDQYERTLAYVWIDTGSTYVMVNEIMLATDHAEPVYIEPNLRYADTFRLYEG
ncbi:MAG: thermonuclease family protein [Saccharofermentans sp.]|nr:thermonuclease family protein [Saccharofermentans sp.]